MTDSDTLRVGTVNELYRVGAVGRPIGVDRKENVLRGYVIMQLGLLRDRPGEVDQLTLEKTVELGNALKQGLKSRFTHPTECSDGLGRYLGRTRSLFMSEATTRDGKKVMAVRGDLHLDPTALDTPPDGGKPLGKYVMDLAESDPDALSSSVVIRFKREYRLEADGTRKKNPETGEDLPPLLRPEVLFASDVVDEGAAVDGLFSADDLPNAHLWKGAEILDGMFDGLSRAEVRERTSGWLARYLELRFGPEEPPPPAPPPAQPAQPSLSVLAGRQRLRELDLLG